MLLHILYKIYFQLSIIGGNAHPLQLLGARAHTAHPESTPMQTVIIILIKNYIYSTFQSQKRSWLGLYTAMTWL